MNTWRKVKKTVGILLMVAVVAGVLLLLAVSVFNRTGDRPTFLFGHTLTWVQTGSMEPTIPEKSYILVKQAEKETVAQGTIITFRCTDPSSAVYGSLITHRVQEVTSQGYRTKGDNSSPDPWLVAGEDILAVYQCNLPIMTACGRLFTSPVGLLLILALFLGSWVFIYIPDLIRAMGGGSDRQAEKEELIRQRVCQEVEKLRQQEKRGDQE